MNAYVPEKEYFSEYLTCQSNVIARNCRIDDITVTGAVLGGLWAPNTAAQVVCVKHSSKEMHLQLQAKCEDVLKCVHLGLCQAGNDVAAWIEGAAYTSPREPLGFDFPKPVPIAANADASGYGVSRLFFTTSVLQTMRAFFSQFTSNSFDEFLSKDEKIIARNVNFKDFRVTGGILGGAWVKDTPALVECVERNDVEMRLQLQAKCNDFLKVVHVTFRHVGGNIVARVDWAAAISAWNHELGFDFSKPTFAPVAEVASGAGYGVAQLSFIRKSLLSVSTCVLPSESVHVNLCPHAMVDPKDIHVGLYWLDGDNYGGWIVDKEVKTGKKGTLVAKFAMDELANRLGKLSHCPNRLFPVVYFTGDGTYNNAWYHTTLAGAKNTPGMVISLYPETITRLEKCARILKKQEEREAVERKRQELSNAEFIYIDGNNFCWENSKANNRRFGLALVDRILSEFKQDSVRARFPRAKIRVFFDGGITNSYRPEFLKRLNDGMVTICPGKADQVMLDESRTNCCEDKTFIISNDNFDEFKDYSIVKNHRVIKSMINNSMFRIPEMDTAFEFNPTHFAHVPMKHVLHRQSVSINAHVNGKFLCADEAGQDCFRPIVANRDTVTAWEEYSLCPNEDGTISLRSHANGKYLTAMINEGGQLIARADTIDSWEKFWITRRQNGGEYILRSFANMKYVSVNPFTGLASASVDIADEWEWLNVSKIL